MSEARGSTHRGRSVPLTRPSARLLQTQAAEIIREAILSGRLAQGSRLNELSLSRQLGISRGPVREALRILEEDGLAVSTPYRGARVIRISTENMIAVMEVRSLLEPFAVTRAVARTGRSITKPLREAMSEMLKGAAEKDGPRVARAHTAFHGIFYAHADNPLLDRLWKRIAVPVRLYLQIQQTGFGSLKEVAHGHDELMELVAKGDQSPLRRHTLQHVQSNLQFIMRALGEENR